MVQKHLTYEEMTNFGCFYTPEKFVNKTIGMIEKNIPDLDKYFLVDTSCGYGTFLKSLSKYQTIGCDIDSKAIDIAKKMNPNASYFNLNSLYNFSKTSLNLNEKDKIIIVGNPPYNDITSKVKNEIKKGKPCLIDNDIRTRDLGISFMLSYNKLKADYVVILHPLSYMIKKANFSLLKPFFENYILIDHCIINSQEFNLTSKTTGFPIIIAIYKRDGRGFKYDDILNLEFRTIDNKKFNLNHDYIGNYISKYPSKWKQKNDNDILFYTMRDINALKRSRTFIIDNSPNAISIDKNKISYYCYVDVFKEYIDKLPYYLGNIEVFIDNEEFLKIQDVFITKSIFKHEFLKDKIKWDSYNDNYHLIDLYFKKLFAKI